MFSINNTGDDFTLLYYEESVRCVVNININLRHRPNIYDKNKELVSVTEQFSL